MKVLLLFAVLAVLGALWLANVFDKQTMERIYERKDAQTVQLTAQNHELTVGVLEQNKTLTAAELKNADRLYALAQANQALVGLLGMGLVLAILSVPVSFVVMLLAFRRKVARVDEPTMELPYERTLIMRKDNGDAYAVVHPVKELQEYRR